MAEFVGLQGDTEAVNMDHVIDVTEGTEQGTLVLTLVDGRAFILKGDQAERMKVWLRNRADVPIVSGANIDPRSALVVQQRQRRDAATRKPRMQG